MRNYTGEEVFDIKKSETLVPLTISYKKTILISWF